MTAEDINYASIIILIIVLCIYIYVRSKLVIDTDIYIEKQEKHEQELKNSKQEDYSFDLMLVFSILGGVLGYINQPGMYNFIPLPFTVDGRTGLDRYVITGAILGAAIGWVIGKFIKREQ